MAKSNFAHALGEVLKHEGGWSDHPSDPGGGANLGVTLKTLAMWRGVSPWWELPKSVVIRRIPEVGGILVTIVTFFAAIPPEQQAVVIAILTGNGGGLTIGALIGLAMWVYAQIVSFQQTTKPRRWRRLASDPSKSAVGASRWRIS